MVRRKIRLKHYALATEDTYCWWVGKYYDYCFPLPAGKTPEQKAEAFLTDLAVTKRLSARSQNQALAALLFLYAEVLEKPLGKIDALRAKRPQRERTSPSREQVRLLRSAMQDTPTTPARLLIDLLYGCGMRVSEPISLRVKDVLWEENQVVIRGAKGGKDRRVPIPASLIAPLRGQLEIARKEWERDRQNTPTVGVSLPHQLGKKYPNAAFTWQWFWIFPARGHCNDPYSGKRVRYHLLPDALQRAVYHAAVQVGLDGLITPHVLRHAYATHSRESIEALRQLMGHTSIETTAGYRHAAIDAATNPLDDMIACFTE